MVKRGQVTVFIVVGIVIFLSVISLFLLRSQIITEELPQEIILTGENIKNYVNSCLEKTAKEAILENGRSGGYFILPDLSTADLYYNVPYYYVFEQDFSPTDEKIEEEMERYIDVFLDLCLDNFQPFEGHTITKGNPTTAVRFSTTKIIVTTDLPVAIELGVLRKDISSFQVEVPADQLYQNIITARKIVETSKKEICLTCFSDLAKENDLFVNILPSFTINRIASI